jgi:hypothetical protein
LPGARRGADPDNDRNPLVALREIADRRLPPDELRETPIDPGAALDDPGSRFHD